MTDPWDVYVSFMKMNGVPLLPPVLTKERRSEMQYYQLLAKEVESRISRLTPYCVQTNGDSEQDKETTSDSTVCDSPPNSQQQEDVKSVQDLAAHIESALKNLVGERIETPSKRESVMKLSNHQSKSTERKKDTLIYNFTTLPEKEDKKEEPEKDGSCSMINSKGVMAKGKKISFGASPSPDRAAPVSPTDKNAQDKSAAISKKRMSGSLMDLSHTSPERKSHIPRLQRQNSYTLLAPSPQLLAHLESRSQQAGPDTKLSSSDSQCSPKQKRRNWDLETAKVKWSDMAMELKQNHGVPKLTTKSSKAEKQTVAEKVGADTLKSDRQSQTIVRAKSSPLRNRLSSLSSRTVMRTDVKVEAAVEKSPPRRVSRPATPSPPNGRHRSSPTPASSAPEHPIPPQYIIGEKEDPARKVRDLFETIQKQQIMQMASLVEKQKREQMMLQQVFEEQNMYISRQIKNICPEIEIHNVSLDAPTRDLGGYDPYYGGLTGMEGPKGTVSTYVYHYDGMLPPRPPGATDYKNIKYPPFTRNIITQTRPKKQSAKSPKSKKGKERSSKVADSSDDIEFMAEQVRFPVDDHGELLMADDCNILRGTCVRPAGAKRPCSPAACDKHGSVSFSRGPSKPAEDKDELECELEGEFERERVADVQREDELQDEREREQQRACEEQQKRERAAATCIVAHARGYLTRRLMRTAKVRALVQTIRDALLCALQLHQDRDGVRGADVDLHRRLIQQITAACYAVHETVITNPIAQKMAIIAADRVRQKALAAKQPTPLARRASPTASPLQRRQSSASPNLHYRASHTVATANRRDSPGPPSPTLQRRGSPTCPLASRQSSPTPPPAPRRASPPPPAPRRASPPAPLVQRRPSPTAAQTARPPHKRTGVMSQSCNGGGIYTVPPYSQPAPPAQLLSNSTHDAGITVKVGRGHSGQQKRWL